MRKQILLLMLLLSSLNIIASIKEPMQIKINSTQTVTITFDNNIKYVDFGSEDILGDKTSHQNILMLRSKKDSILQTTASVVTSDGAYHSFNLSYQSLLVDTDFILHNDSLVKDTQMDYIELSDIHTIHLICDEKITDIYVGSDSIIADYAENIDNIVRCKAISKQFDNTSLTLITASGDVLNYMALYNAKPTKMNILIKGVNQNKNEEIQQVAQFNDNSINEIKLKHYAEKIITLPPTLTNVGVISQNMIFGLYGLYIQDNILMFHVNLANNTNIDYEVDFVKMYITDEKKSKKIAMQEEEITPIFVYNQDEDKLIKGKSSSSSVLFFNRFTIPPKRVLYIEVFERNGGRHIKFKITNKEILGAKKINTNN